MISKKINSELEGASQIRQMFEAGEKLRQQFGAENVFDFSLGNPWVEPPAIVRQKAIEVLQNGQPGLHRYMSNAGLPDIRVKLAQNTKEETGLPIESGHVIITCGAAGALNVAMKALLDPSDEVIIFSPYFVEYNFYIENHGGVPVPVQTLADTFELDPEALRRKITPRTKAIILNSPNNPTGVIYSEESLKQVAQILKEKEEEYGTSIYVLSDEPYSKLVYDGYSVPQILTLFTNSILINSVSKSLSLPGERIGYMIVNPSIYDGDKLLQALAFCNRILGFVNAPSLFQRALAEIIGVTVDVEEYKIRRDLMYSVLQETGFECILPRGAFYLFPKCPIESDIEFAKRALEHNIIVVPGSGFGYPGYFRISYCTSLETIANSKAAFGKLMASLA